RKVPADLSIRSDVQVVGCSRLETRQFRCDFVGPWRNARKCVRARFVADTGVGDVGAFVCQCNRYAGYECLLRILNAADHLPVSTCLSKGSTCCEKQE